MSWCQIKNKQIVNHKGAVSITQCRFTRYCCHIDKMHKQHFFSWCTNTSSQHSWAQKNICGHGIMRLDIHHWLYSKSLPHSWHSIDLQLFLDVSSHHTSSVVCRVRHNDVTVSPLFAVTGRRSFACRSWFGRLAADKLIGQITPVQSVCVALLRCLLSIPLQRVSVNNKMSIKAKITHLHC